MQDIKKMTRGFQLQGIIMCLNIIRMLQTKEINYKSWIILHFFVECLFYFIFIFFPQQFVKPGIFPNSINLHFQKEIFPIATVIQCTTLKHC